MKAEYDFSKGRRGAVVPAPRGKTRITIRLDDEVLDWFRQQTLEAGGGNYQSLINEALREHIASRREPLEETLRRVLREEMPRYQPGAPARPGAGGRSRAGSGGARKRRG